MIDRLDRSRTKQLALKLDEGLNYVIFAVCTGNCRQVHLALFDAQGELLLETPELETIVKLQIKPERTGTYVVALSAPGCASDTCEAGILFARQEASTGGAPAPIPNAAHIAPVLAPDGPPKDIVLSLQMALQQAGCHPGPLDNVWGQNAKAALARFAKHSGVVLASSEPSEALLAAISIQDRRVCPQPAPPIHTPAIAVKPLVARRESPAQSTRTCEPQSDETFSQTRRRWRRC